MSSSKVRARVALYTRVSTREQANKGYSLRAQVEELRKYCDRHDMKVSRIYQDRGFSGSTLRRPLLQKMLHHAQYRHSFETILLWKFDRLSRKTRDLLEIVEYLKALDIGLMSVTETLDATTPFGMCMLTVSISIAQMERENIIERSKLGQLQRAREGKWRGGTPPFGYSYNRDTGFLEIVPEEAEVVREIFHQYVKLKAINRVKHFLISEGYQPRIGSWHNQKISRILNRHLYTGNYSFREVTRYRKSYKIINQSLFNRVKKNRKVCGSKNKIR